MSSRKRPFSEISQTRLTPSKHGPSTPHAIRALQQRSGATARSARSIRRFATETVRPDSIRGVLRQFAKISAPATKKRIVTPRSVIIDKENLRPNNEEDNDDDNDSLVLDKPNLTFSIEETFEDDDSDLPTAPTPSALPEDEEYDQPTVTFHNRLTMPINPDDGPRHDRRKSYASFIHSEPIAVEEEDAQEGDNTILTERGRRALSEEATGRLSRYSFGSIRMSDFGSELEIRRDSNKDNLDHSTVLEANDYVPLQGDESIDFGETENLRNLRRSPVSEAASDTTHMSAVGDETFRLDMPQDDVQISAQSAHSAAVENGEISPSETSLPKQQLSTEAPGVENSEQLSRRQTLLETATTTSQVARRKRLKLTRHGTTVPSLPTSLIKRIVFQLYEKQNKRKPTLGRDHLKALEQATEWFFDQIGEDLAAYSSHGRRKKRVDANDVSLLMKRQRALGKDLELQKLAKSWLPKDVMDGLDLSDAL